MPLISFSRAVSVSSSPRLWSGTDLSSSLMRPEQLADATRVGPGTDLGNDLLRAEQNGAGRDHVTGGDEEFAEVSQSQRPRQRAALLGDRGFIQRRHRRNRSRRPIRLRLGQTCASPIESAPVFLPLRAEHRRQTVDELAGLLQPEFVDERMHAIAQAPVLSRDESIDPVLVGGLQHRCGITSHTRMLGLSQHQHVRHVRFPRQALQLTGGRVQIEDSVGAGGLGQPRVKPGQDQSGLEIDGIGDVRIRDLNQLHRLGQGSGEG